MRPRFGFLLAAICSCGGTCPSSAVSTAPIVVPTVPVASAATAPVAAPDPFAAEWAALAEHRQIERPPGGDAECETSRSGVCFRYPDATSRAALASKFNCEVPRAAPHIAEGAYQGSLYCCPRTRLEAPLSRAAGAKGCQQAVDDYSLAAHARAASAIPTVTFGMSADSLTRSSAYFQHCGVPDAVVISICVAVSRGQAVGVTVSTRPRENGYAECVGSAVLGLSFPPAEGMDMTLVSF